MQGGPYDLEAININLFILYVSIKEVISLISNKIKHRYNQTSSFDNLTKSAVL